MGDTVEAKWKDPDRGDIHALKVHDLRERTYASAETACGLRVRQDILPIDEEVSCAPCLDALTPPYMREFEQAARDALAKYPVPA